MPDNCMLMDDIIGLFYEIENFILTILVLQAVTFNNIQYALNL